MDVATLQVNVVQTGAAKVASDLASVGTAGETAAARVAAANAQVANAFKTSGSEIARANLAIANAYKSTGDAAQQAMAKQGEATQSLWQKIVALTRSLFGLSDANKAATSSAAGFGDANLKAAEHASHHSITLGRVEKSFESFIVKATGANEQLALLTTAFGHLEFGAVAMIGALAGLFVVVKVFEYLTEAANKAKKEQEELTKSAEKWYEVEKRGVAGERIQQLEAETKRVHDLTDAYNKAAIAAQGAYAGGAGGGLGVQYGAIGRDRSKEDLDKAKATQKAAEDEINKVLGAAINQRAELYVRDLANLIKNNQATGAERQRAVALLKDFQTQLLNSSKITFKGEPGVGGKTADEVSIAFRNMLSGMTQELTDALNPQLAAAVTSRLAGITDQIGQFEERAKSFGTEGDITQQVERYRNSLKELQAQLDRDVATHHLARDEYTKDSAAIAALGERATKAGDIIRTAFDARTTQQIHEQNQAQRGLFDALVGGTGAYHELSAAKAAQLEISERERTLGHALSEQAKEEIRDTHERGAAIEQAHVASQIREQAAAYVAEIAAIRSGASTRSTYAADLEYQTRAQQAQHITNEQVKKDYLDAAEAAHKYAVELELLKGLAQTVAAELPKVSKQAIDQSIREIVERNEQYTHDLGKIWSDGIGKILTDGFKSVADFTQDTLQLFSKLRERMYREGNDSGLAYTLLGIGSAAIVGGSAGYAIGQHATSGLSGVAAGAAAGALAGSEFGPWGTVIGGLTGAVAGLLGAADAHKRAAQAIENAAKSLATNIAAYTQSNPVAAALADNLNKQTALLQQAADLLNARAEQGGKDKNRDEVTSAFQQYNNDLEAIKKAAIENAKKIAVEFWAGITQAMNALNGPAGAYQNSLDAIQKQYTENVSAVLALASATHNYAGVAEGLAKVEALRAAQEAQAKADEEKRIAALALQNTRATEDAYLAADRAAANGQGGSQAARDAVELQAKILADQREIADLQAQQASAELIAAVKAKNAAEEAALAWQQSQAAIERATAAQRALDDLQVRALGAQGNTQGADDLRFQLQQQRELEDAIKAGQSQDYIDKLKEVLSLEAKARATGAAGPTDLLAVNRGLPPGQTEATVYAAKALTETTGNRMADYLSAILIVERQQLDVMRNGPLGATRPLGAPSFSFAQPVPNQTGITGADVDRLLLGIKSVANTSTGTVNKTVNIKVERRDDEDLDTYIRKVTDAVKLEMANEFRDEQIRAGDPSRPV